MPDINQIITEGIGTPSDIEHYILDGLNANPEVATDPAYGIDVLASLLDLTVVVPGIAQEYTSVYYTYQLARENGDLLKRENGDVLTALVIKLEHAHVIHAPLQDLTVVVPEDV